MHPDTDIDLIQRLAVALAIGLIIGIERGWQRRDEAEGERALGLRTHALAGLLGGVWGALARGRGDGGLVMLGIAAGMFTIVIVAFRLREIWHHGTFGATTAVAAMIAFALGALAVLGDTIVASAAGVATAGLLAVKAALHAWVRRLSWQELRAGLLLLAMTVILLPILPNRELGPYGAFNPHQIWLMAVMIAVVSFAGYAAIRVAGESRGILMSGLAGGLVSSTAVTLSMARLARSNDGEMRLFMAGALLANVAMMIRVVAITAFFNPVMALWLASPLGLAALTQAAMVGLLMLRQERGAAASGTLDLKNPFELSVVLAFAALLSLILLLGKLAAAWAGTRGVYVLAAASGLADVDAITLSLAKLGRSDLKPSDAGTALLLAVGVNTVVKGTLAWITGGHHAGRVAVWAAATALVALGLGLQIAMRLSIVI